MTSKKPQTYNKVKTYVTNDEGSIVNSVIGVKVKNEQELNQVCSFQMPPGQFTKLKTRLEEIVIAERVKRILKDPKRKKLGTDIDELKKILMRLEVHDHPGDNVQDPKNEDVIKYQTYTNGILDEFSNIRTAIDALLSKNAGTKVEEFVAKIKGEKNLNLNQTYSLDSDDNQISGKVHYRKLGTNITGADGHIISVTVGTTLEKTKYNIKITRPPTENKGNKNEETVAVDANNVCTDIKEVSR